MIDWVRMSQICSRCGVSRYGHIDHAHTYAIAWPNPCPFGDCGEFQP